MLGKEIRQHIIAPVLQVVNMWSPSAEILVYGTGMVESNYNHLVQIGNPKNGGLGFWQLETSDFTDICLYLRNNFNKGLIDRVLAACYYITMPVDPSVLIHNIKLSCLFCRIHYWRVKEPLPKADDFQGLAAYHKRYYNSSLGDADVVKNTEVFKVLVDENN